MPRPTVNHSGINTSLLLALLGSVLLHLGILFGVSMRHAAREPYPIEVRLVSSAAPVSPATMPASPAPPLRNQERPRMEALASRAIPVASETSTPVKPVPSGDALSAKQLSSEPPAATVRTDVANTKASSPDLTYYSGEQLDELPRMLGEVRQIYPVRARNAGIEGFVTLSLLINERGEVDEIHVVKSRPSGFFEDSAIAMLRGQHFTPAIKQGQAVRSRWQKTVRFKLQD